jgi:Fe2+ transport system protein FeoA
MADAPRFLFIPVSGPGGTGEYYRSLAVARGIERRWPGCSIKFVISRHASYAQGGPFPVLLVDRSPTFETAAVVKLLQQERPHVVVFDSAGRVDQYKAARQAGARVVFVSSRATTRAKGFRLRRLSGFDQHWIAQPRYLGGDLSRLERLKLRLVNKLEVLFLEVIHEPIDEPATRDLQQELGLQPGSYVLACPGGGGLFGGGPDAAKVFLGAAEQVVAETSFPVLAVLGPRFAAPGKSAHGLHVRASLPNGVLMGMLRDARVAIINGGSLLTQAMALGTPCVAAPISDDQPQRIARTADRGLVRPASLDVAALAAAAVQLVRDDAARDRLRGRLAQLGLRNGVDVAVAAIGRLLPPAVALRGSDVKAS